MPTKSSTNTDIINLLTSQHDEVKDRLIAVEAQVKYTNGRVNRMEAKWEAQEAVEKYKSSQPTIQVNNQQTDWPKIVLAVLGVLGTALGVIATMAATK